jgi:hypothetical protein
MAIEPLTLQLNDSTELTFKRWPEIRAFLEEEASIWAWLNPTLQGMNLSGITSSYVISHNGKFEDLNGAEASGPDIASFTQLASGFSKTGPLFYSRSRQGEAILRARELGGDRAGAQAYAMFINAGVGFPNGVGRSEAIALVMAAFPEFGDSQMLAERLAAERANYRSSLNRRLADIEEAHARQEREWRTLLGQAMHRSRRTFRRRIRLWNEQQKARDEAGGNAIGSIKNTEQTFTEFMRLRAPVKYWEEEANRHGSAKLISVKRLKIFFPLSGALIVIGFAIGAAVLINSNPENRSILQFIVAGSLISVSTILFWVGRILTKLYLSEHHLEQDASQRAVMTTTYLALLDQGGATADADRGAIIAALFRSTPDGIVKDEGPADAMGLAGLLSKLGVR